MGFTWTLLSLCVALTSGQSSYRYHESKYERQPGNAGYQQFRQTSSDTSRHVDYEQIRRMVRAELDEFRQDQLNSGQHNHLSALSRDLQELGRKVDQLMLRQTPQRDVGQQLERRFDNWITSLEQRFFTEQRSCEGMERSLAELKSKLDLIQQLISQQYNQRGGALSGSSGSLHGRLQDPYRFNDLRNSQNRVTGVTVHSGRSGLDSSRETIPDSHREDTNEIDVSRIGVHRESDYKFRWEEKVSRTTPVPTTPSTPFWRHIRTVATAAPRPANQHGHAYDYNNRDYNSRYNRNEYNTNLNRYDNRDYNSREDYNHVDNRDNHGSASQTGGRHVVIKLPRPSNYSFRYPDMIGETEDPRPREPETTPRPTPHPTLRPTLRPTPRPTERPSQYVRFSDPVRPTPNDPYRHQPRNQVQPRPRINDHRYVVTSPPRRDNPYRFRYTDYIQATARPQTSQYHRSHYDDNVATTATPRTAQWYNNWMRKERTSGEAYGRREEADELQMAHHVLSDEESNFDPSAKYGQCPLYIRGLGTSELERKSLYSLVGTWLGDAGAQDPRIWAVEGGNALHWSSLVEYEDLEAFETLIGQTQHTLPETCTGLGPVIFEGHLYCQAYTKNNQDHIDLLKIDLATNEIVARGRLNGQHGRRLGVSGKGWAGIYLQLQLMVDETGMWALAGEADTRRLVLFKVDPTDLEVLSMTRLARRKDTVGPTFMTCGVLYALDSHYATQLAYTYDTKRQQEKDLAKGTDFSFPPLEVISLQYNPVDRKLYMWKVTKKAKDHPFKQNKISRKRMFGIGELLSPYTTPSDYLF